MTGTSDEVPRVNSCTATSDLNESRLDQRIYSARTDVQGSRKHALSSHSSICRLLSARSLPGRYLDRRQREHQQRYQAHQASNVCHGQRSASRWLHRKTILGRRAHLHLSRPWREYHFAISRFLTILGMDLALRLAEILHDAG